MESSTFTINNISTDFNWTKNDTQAIAVEVVKPWPKALTALWLMLYVTMMITAGLGNILTICAYLRYKHLRTVHNTYICNLAIADAGVGFISLVIYVYVFHGLNYNWSSLSRWVCKFWLFEDYTVTSVGALSVGLISYDRYCLVADGMKYMTSQTMLKAKLRCGFIWAATVIIMAPGMLFYDYIEEQKNEPWECTLEFSDNLVYTNAIITFNFIIPLGMVTTFNFLVHLEIRKRTAKFVKGNEQEDNRLQRDKRAARSLTILVLALFICWLPWQVLLTVDPLCSSCNIPLAIWEICGPLVWLNSCINPFLYTLTYPKFREAFIKMLMPWRRGRVQDSGSNHTASTIN